MDSITTTDQLEIVEDKRTSLELYLTASQAYDMWKKNKKGIKILDVRTVEEYIFVGHPEMAVNIPLAHQSHVWSTEKQIFDVTPNDRFLEKVNTWAKKDDTILITCRSGGRSAMAVNMLANQGFKKVYNIIDGFEGDIVKEDTNPEVGKRKVNGWINSGCPWTYEINPEQVLL